jgi:hypothetical protein
MEATPFRLFAGIDWASEEHTISILDANRNELENKAYKHSGTGLSQLAERLTTLSGSDVSTVAVGIETPHGAIVETLVERGFAVFSLNPKQMDRFRDRHSVSGAKDDKRDAYVIADALATDMKKFHRVQLSGPQIIRLRQLCRSDEDVKQNQVQIGNQLRDLLNRYFPQLLALCPGVDEPWFWDLLEKVPLPEQANETFGVEDPTDSGRPSDPPDRWKASTGSTSGSSSSSGAWRSRCSQRARAAFAPTATALPSAPKTDRVPHRFRIG